MRFNKLIFTFAAFFLFAALASKTVFGQDAGKLKGPGGKNNLGGVVPVQGGKGGGHGLLLPKDETDADVQQALEELKLLTADVSRKSSVNRGILVGSAIANSILLLFLSGLVGYTLKETKDKKKKDEEKDEKKKPKNEKKGEQRGGSESGDEK